MELSDLEIKILKLLSKQKTPVNLAFVSTKCGECEKSLNNLYNKNYIDSSLIDDCEQLAFPSFNDMTISKEGLEYLANLKLNEQHKTSLLNKREFWEIMIGIFIAVAAVVITKCLGF